MNSSFASVLTALSLAALSGLDRSAQATIIASDGFDYAAGSSIVGQNGGAGFGGAWRNVDSSYGDFVVGSSSLVYSGFIRVGGDLVGTNGGTAGGSADGRILSAESNSFGSSIVWVAFDATFKANNGGTPTLRFVNNGAVTGGIGGNNNYANWSIMGPGLTTSTFTSTPLNGANDLVVVEINYAANMTSLWMNPTVSTFDGTQTPSMTVNFSPIFNDIQIVTKGANAIDQITVATTYSETLPEPSSLALLAGGLLAIAAERRRRRAGVRG